MTPQELKDIEARANAATPGPWRCGNGDEGWFWGFLVADTVADGCPDDKPSPAVLADFNRHVRYDANIAFCARARSDIPNLLAYIAALTERLRAVEAERDEARSGVKKSAEAYGALMEHAEKLRAELERKDAALKLVSSDRWADAACIRGVARAALQPKEPPCQTA